MDRDLVIYVPIFLPPLDNFGFSPLFFGVVIALNLQTGFLSPPVAMAAFDLKGVAPKHVTLERFFAGVMPLVYIVVFCMLLTYMFPELALWLPDYLDNSGGGPPPDAGPTIEKGAPASAEIGPEGGSFDEGPEPAAEEEAG
jgi:hypothetical protein